MKNTKLIVFVSALLCAVMALSSCTGSAALPNNDALANDPVYESPIVPTESEGNETPTIDTTTASGKLAVWLQYIKYNPASIEGIKASSSNNLTVGNKYSYQDYASTDYGVVIQYYNNTEVGEGQYAGKTFKTHNVRVYNVYEGTDPIFSYNSTYTVKSSDSTMCSAATIVTAEYVENGVFCVKTESWKAVYEQLPEGSTETPEILGYERDKTTYDLYLNDGTYVDRIEYASDYEFYYYNYVSVLTVNGVCYVLDNYGKLVTEIDEKFFVDDPFIEATLADRIVKIGEYYFENISDRYVIYDADGKYVSEYKKGSDDLYVILKNGNILVQNKTELRDGINEYDYYDYNSDIKYAVNTELVDIATGNRTAVDFPYVITKFIGANNTSYTSVVGDYVFVVANKYENGMLAAETSYLVLNADASVKEVLPEIIPNQTGAIECVDADTVLIPTTMTGRTFKYRVTDGNFYAFDKAVNVGFAGFYITSVYEDDEYVNQLVDYSGNVIVNKIESYYSFVEDGKSVSVVIKTYDEKNESQSYALYYYNAENDRVEKVSLFSGKTEDYRCSLLRPVDNAFVLLVYDYDDSEYSAYIYNLKGSRVYSLNADSYSTGSVYYTFVETISSGSNAGRYTTTINFANNKIVVKTQKTNSSSSSENYFRYTIIK